MQIIEIFSVSHFNEMCTFQFSKLESWGILFHFIGIKLRDLQA